MAEGNVVTCPHALMASSVHEVGSAVQDMGRLWELLSMIEETVAMRRLCSPQSFHLNRVSMGVQVCDTVCVGWAAAG